jgi:exonuclease 3'-5' domain-containing protein 1
MTSLSVHVECILVNSIATLSSFLDKIIGLPTNSSPLFLDLEGENLGRHGSISIITVFIVPENTVYLIDVYHLGSQAFTVTKDKVSIKSVLESTTVIKAFFDVRNDSDALFNLYQISLNGVKDVQLMELACRPGPDASKKYLAGLAKCVAKDSVWSDAQKEAWRRVKQGTAALFDSKTHDGPNAFNKRPLDKDVERYCTQDVTVLPGLYNIYDKKLRRPGESFWRAQVQQATKDRIKLSQTPKYDGRDMNKALGPWSESEIEQAIEDWNEDVMFEAMHGDEAEDWDEGLLDDIMMGDYDDCYDHDGYDNYQDTARDCVGWEEDMIKNGEWF